MRFNKGEAHYRNLPMKEAPHKELRVLETSESEPGKSAFTML